MFGKCIACALSILLVAGCTTHRVCFTSAPVGASVQVGGKTGITPCTLKIPKDTANAVFILPSGERMELPVTDLDSGLEQASHGVAKAGGVLLMGTGALAIGAGLGALAIYSSMMDDEPEWYTGDTQKDPHSGEVLAFGLLATLGGGAVFALGDWIYPDRDVPEVHADFIKANTNGVVGDSYYEDVGFGARRLKQTNP